MSNKKLPRTKGYNLTKYYSAIFSAIIFVLFMSVFQIINSFFEGSYFFIVGILLGALFATGFHLFQKKTSPGQIKHFKDYQDLPKVLSGNKNENI